ncbi:unnamed protein product [Urochloa humidicola]
MQFPVLLEKLDALDPPKKRTRRSAKKKKSDDRPTLTPEIRAGYKEMGVILKGFLKELGDDVDGAAAAGGSTSKAQGAPPPPPPPAADDKQYVNDGIATVPCTR